MRGIGFLALIPLFVATLTFAAVFGTVRGVVHDPQHRPVPGTNLTLKATDSEYTRTATTDADGQFIFDAVPLGTYSITVSRPGFASAQQPVTVLSGASPVLHFELQIASRSEEVSVVAETAPAQMESVTPTTLVGRNQIDSTPGATRTNSLALITDFVPGSYLTHDQLHIRGGHQVSWLIDGVPIPNTNIASNLGPQIDPKDIDTLEAQRGSYTSDYGDRTYGVFNVVPRSGFERNNEAELVLSAGNFYQTDDQFKLGGHTNRFAYYASVNGNRTNLGLQNPTSAVIHDAANGNGVFGSLIYNAGASDQLRMVGQTRRDFYQVPGQDLHDVNREADSFVTFSWLHTLNPGLVTTVSPFYHYNRANYESSPLDLPSSATERRSSSYAGGQASLSWVQKANNLRAGVYTFAQRDNQSFELVYNNKSAPSLNPPDLERPSGSLGAADFE